ncbi:MAG TPA: hypothetical protein DCG30_03270 [Ruminococcus sp.]|nr:hypothetical protein [Ruminococcus sp.]
MQCDFHNVTEILMRNMASSNTIYYNNLLNTLFGSYLAEMKLFQFDRSATAKLHSGAIRISTDMSEYYLTADPKILCGDIKELLQYIFDKPNTFKELYELIQFDDTLSVPMRKEILNHVSPQYSDDNSLVQMIYEAVFIAVTRQYEKVGKVYVAPVYASQLAPEGKSLFSNSEYIPPCKHFCGRDEELNELHKIVTENSTVIITGVAGIGKSELVRAYAKEHKTEYQYFGYYFYNGSLKDIISDILRDPITADLNTHYFENLKLLSGLGEKVLLIIDNFNAMPEEDESFYDLCDIKCKVIFTSHMRFEDYATYELQAFRSVDDLKTLTKYFYQYKKDEWKYLLEIYANLDMHTFCVELCAKAFTKGVFNPLDIYTVLCYHKVTAP